MSHFYSNNRRGSLIFAHSWLMGFGCTLVNQMPSNTLHPIRGNTLIPSLRTSLSLGWNVIVEPERKAKRFTAASTRFHIKHHFTPVTHVAPSLPSPPTCEQNGHRGQLVWLIVAACRLCIRQHEGTLFGYCSDTGHGYRASEKGSGRQKKYSCSGVAEPLKPKQDPSQVPVAPPVVSSA